MTFNPKVFLSFTEGTKETKEEWDENSGDSAKSCFAFCFNWLQFTELEERFRLQILLLPIIACGILV